MADDEGCGLRLRRRRVHRRPALLGLAALASVTVACAPAPVPRAGWHLGWHAELAAPGFSAATLTCRFTARLVTSGSRLRVELADPASARGLGFHVRSVAVAPVAIPSPAAAVTFAGGAEVTVAPRTSRVSDPVPLPAVRGSSVVVTMTVDPGDAPSTVRLGEPAECGAAGASLRPSAQVHWLSGVQVDSAAVRSVAAFGDSITEGIGLVPGRYQRWTDRVAAGGTAIVNGGVSGGALTRTGVPASVPGLTRLPALLAQPGLTDVVLEMGINDLGAGVSASALLVGYERALAQVTARGLTPWVATVTPRIGSPWSAAREQQRRTINALLRSGWLSSRGGNLIDLDAALRDPREPDRLAPAYDSGDHLHPNSAGALRIAGTVAGALRLPPPR